MKLIKYVPIEDVLAEFTGVAGSTRDQLDDWVIQQLEAQLEVLCPEGVDYGWLHAFFETDPNGLARLIGFKDWDDLQAEQTKVYWGRGESED